MESWRIRTVRCHIEPPSRQAGLSKYVRLPFTNDFIIQCLHTFSTGSKWQRTFDCKI